MNIASKERISDLIHSTESAARQHGRMLEDQRDEARREAERKLLAEETLTDAEFALISE